MSTKFKLAFLILLLFGAGLLIVFYLSNHSIAIFDPQGIIALQQRDLIVTAILLSLTVVLPVFALTIFIGFKYREGNNSADFSPDWKHNKFIEFSWWAIPSLVIMALAVLTVNKTHELDPFKPIESANKTLTIQVVALQWKWLFIYPEQDIATVNFVQFPVDTPVNFELTADAPMNSFWIPKLGGQMYAMPGMGTKLNLLANSTGEFSGSTAEISGKGFAGMRFTAKSSSLSDFDTWVQEVRDSTKTLDLTSYKKLASPSENNPIAFYSSTKSGLYNDVIMQFMMPNHHTNHIIEDYN